MDKSLLRFSTPACTFCYQVSSVNLDSSQDDRAMCSDCYAFIFSSHEPAEQAFRLGALLMAHLAQPKRSNYRQAVRDLAQRAEDERKARGWLILPCDS